jgi:hypothetical protein
MGRWMERSLALYHVKIYVGVFGLPCIGQTLLFVYICTDGAEYESFTRGRL